MAKEEPVKILGEELSNLQRECIILSIWVQVWRDRRHGNRNVTEIECSLEKLEDMQWSVV